jgi:hypothetical protein
MKLGTQTGSVTNHIYSRATKGQPTPEVGMGVTILSWTDRHAGTIIGVSEYPHPTVWVRQDKATRTDKNGFSESQTYDYEPNPDGALYRFRFRNNRWEEIRLNDKTGRWNKCEGGGMGLRIGEREEYWDPSF